MQPPNVTVLEGAVGGYAKVVAPARNPDTFERKVRRALVRWGREFDGLLDVERLPVPVLRTERGDDVFELVELIRETNAVAFGTFHTYSSFENEDEPDSKPPRDARSREN